MNADTLRATITANTGITDPALRTAVAARAAGGPPTDQPYDHLAHQIATASHRVTDTDVNTVRDATGSDKATFEIIMSACIGAGLARWDAATHAIHEATNATT